MPVSLHSRINTQTVTPAPLGKTFRTQKNSHIDKNRLRRFPDSPLISTHPVRYNVSLNQQITAVQHSDNYLAKVEKSLVQLSYSLNRSDQSNRAGQVDGVKQQLNAVNQLLDRRSELSANSVDRQLNIVLQGKPKVNFMIKGAESWLTSQDETLIFALDGNKKEYAAVKFTQETESDALLRKLNLNLGRLGIHGSWQDDRLVFSVDEDKWPRIKQQLYVKGEGHRYPDNQFLLVKSQAQVDFNTTIKKLLDNGSLGEIKKVNPQLQQTLEHVGQQRQELALHKESIQERISSISTFPQFQMALDASLRLQEQLSTEKERYSTLFKATAGQANISKKMVQNLLSE